MKHHLGFAILVVGSVAIGACGGGGNKSASSDAKKAVADLLSSSSTTATTSPFASNETGPQGKPIGKVRIGNLITVGGAPGPAMDVYDLNRPTADVKPLISDLKYGEVSDYVTPHGFTAGDVTSNLYVFPAGSTTPAPSGPLNGSNIDNSGFQDGDQLTVVLDAATAGSGFGSFAFAEAGSRIPSGTNTSAPAGKGELIAASSIDDETAPSEYLQIDGTCMSSLNQGASGEIGTGSPGAVFPVAAGSHMVGVLTSPRGRGLTSCAGKTPPGGTTNVTVSAGDRVDVLAYGPPNAPKLVIAPVG